MHKQSITLASLLTLSAINARAADVTLEVEGTIAAEACVINLENGGVIDYGDITLVSSGRTTLPRRLINGSVNCAAETSVVIQTIDNRPESISDDPAVGTNINYYGLGFDRAGNGIGAWSITWVNPKFITDTGNTSVVRSTDNGASWARSPLLSPTGSWWGSALATNASDMNPQPFTSATFELDIGVVVAPKTALDTSREFNLDGSATLSLIYL